VNHNLKLKRDIMIKKIPKKAFSIFKFIQYLKLMPILMATLTWYLYLLYSRLIQTKPRKECVAEKNISSQGFEVYLPKFALNKKDKPLFPGYIFVHLADHIN